MRRHLPRRRTGQQLRDVVRGDFHADILAGRHWSASDMSLGHVLTGIIQTAFNREFYR